MTMGFERRAQAVLQAALEVPPDARDAYVDTACRGNGELRAEVESLLRALSESGSFLETPALAREAEAIEERLDTAATGARIAGYVVERVVGRGGMGTVYLARQGQTQRLVALKILHAGMSASVLRRFEYEAEILGRLNHPCVAKVFEAGAYDAGGRQLSYIAMEYVDGATSITSHAQREGLDLRQRCQLVVQVAGAAHHGHQNGIIHRDIKPENVLVDPTGTPKVIDFGVARICDAGVTRNDSLTQPGQLLGTLAYMSPEQLDEDSTAIDSRADVYSLGVLFYELLIGETPHDLSGRSLIQSARAIREDPPRRPRALDHDLPRDVEAILLKALEKEPQRRYASAAEFGRDVQRYLESEPVEAHPPGLVTHLRLLARRHRTAFVASIVVFAVLILASAVSLSLAIYARREARQARWESYVGHVLAAESALRNGEFQRLRTELAEAPEEHRGWEWSNLQSAAETSETIVDRESPVWVVRASPDGGRIASAGNDRNIELREVTGGRLLRTLTGHGDNVYDVAFSPDGTVLASASKDQTVRLWDLGSGRCELSLSGAHDRVYGVDFHPDGHLVAGAVWDGRICLWDVATGEIVREIVTESDGVRAVAFHPGGSLLASASSAGRVELWDVEDGECVRAFSPAGPALHTVAFDDSGGRIAAGGESDVVHVWSVADGSRLHALPAAAPVWEVLISPDGETLLAGLSHRIIQRWDLATGRELSRLHGHEELVSSLAFAGSDSSCLISASWDGTVRSWEPEGSDRLRKLVGHTDLVRAAAFSPDDRLIASASWDGTVRLWSAPSGDELVKLQLGDRVKALAFHPREPRISAAGLSGPLRTWSTETGGELAGLRIPELDSGIHSVSFDSDGVHVVIGGGRGSIEIWTTAPPRLLGKAPGGGTDVSELAISPDGSVVAAEGEGFEIRLIAIPSGELIGALSGHEGSIMGLAFSPDGRTLVSGSRDQTLRFWDMARYVERTALRGQGEFFTQVKYHPDGERIAVGSWFDSVKIWATTGEELSTLRGHAGSVRGVSFSHDGKQLISASADGTLRLWDDRPRSTRRADCEAARRLRASALDRVMSLLGKYGDPAIVAQEIHSAKDMDASLRRAALNALLGQAPPF